MLQNDLTDLVSLITLKCIKRDVLDSIRCKHFLLICSNVHVMLNILFLFFIYLFNV